MYLFARTRTVNPARLRDALGFAVEITEVVKQKTGLPVACYNTMFGNDLGTLVWSSTVGSHARLAQATETLMSDESYLEKVEAADPLFTGPARDELRRVMDAEGRMDEPPAVCWLVTAQMELGEATRAVQWSIEMSKYVHGLTGQPMLFLTDAYGSFGQVTWIGGAPDMDAVDTAHDKLDVDPGYIQRIEEGRNFFIPGSGRQGLISRIA